MSAIYEVKLEECDWFRPLFRNKSTTGQS